MGHAELKPQELDRLFIMARQAAAMSGPSDALMERVMQDALADMPTASARSTGAVAHPARVAQSAEGRLARLWLALRAGFGGGGVVASLGAVAVIAVFLGYSAPAGFAEDLMTGLGAGESDAGVEIEPVAIYFLAEG